MKETRTSNCLEFEFFCFVSFFFVFFWRKNKLYLLCGGFTFCVSLCRGIGKRIKSALIWVVVMAIVCGLLLGILYGQLS